MVYGAWYVEVSRNQGPRIDSPKKKALHYKGTHQRTPQKSRNRHMTRGFHLSLVRLIMASWGNDTSVGMVATKYVP